MGSSSVQKVKIHQSSHDLPSYGTPNTFAVKRYLPSHSDHFANETDILKSLKKDDKYLMSLLATFEHRGSYYIIFPRASGGSLYNYWRQFTNAALLEAVLPWFLDQSLSLAEGMAILHNPRKGRRIMLGGLQAKKVLLFSHGVPDGEIGGSSRIAGFNFASRMVEDHPQEVRFSIQTCRPPEVDESKPLFRSLDYDVWTLGCLYLEFICWLLMGSFARGCTNAEQENAVERPPVSRDDIFEVTRRRKLVEQWARMSQEDRTAYDKRAPVRASASWYPAHLRDRNRTTPKSVDLVQFTVPWPLDARSRVLWTKLRVMLYSLDGDSRTLFDADDSRVGIATPSPASPEVSVAPRDFLKWCHVEDADFDAMAMTVEGTVICHRWRGSVLFADREALGTGFVLMCEVHSNGQVQDEARIWAPAMKHEYLRWTALGKRFDDGRCDDRIPGPGRVGPINMEEPALDILKSKRRFFRDGNIYLWIEAIERCAPGCLEMEEDGDGMAPDYDHANFRTHEELRLEKLPWEDEIQLQSGRTQGRDF